MRKIIYFFGVLCASLAISSCADDIADDVYHKPENPAPERLSSLEIQLKNAEAGKQYVIGALAQSAFNEEGAPAGEQTLVFQQPVAGGQAVFANLMDYYNKTLFFNVYEKAGDAYTVVTHLGNQLQYQVTFGVVKKSIDLKESRPEVVRKTTVNVIAPADYNGKTLYLVKPAARQKVEEKLKATMEIAENLYIAKTTVAEGKAVFVMNAPKNKETYQVYLQQPQSGLPYLKRGLEIGYETPAVSCEFVKELPKKIKVTVNREGTMLEGHEVYLMTENDWNQKVKPQVEKVHGSPLPGTYMEMKKTVKGLVTFEQYCTEGEQRYIVYVPKWKTAYYDNYELGSATLVPNKEGTEVLIGDVPVETKIVNFTITIDTSIYPVSPYLSFGYVLDDATKLKSAWNAILSGSASNFKGLHVSSGPVQSTTGSVQINNVEIDPSKEIAVFVPVMQGWSPKAVVKRIKGSEIAGNSLTVKVENIENL